MNALLSQPRLICLAGLLAAGMALPLQARAAQFLVCRVVDLAAPVMAPLLVPAESIFRDNGRADDPMAAFGNDRWQLRIMTTMNVTIQPLAECAIVPVRILSDSSVKSVSAADNRAFVYVGSYRLVDRPEETEAILSLRGKVLDHVP